MVKLSAVIITLNEERNITRCLESVKDVADEIIVVDSLSTDKTAEIARSYGAKVIQQPFLGYVAQKNFADNCASNDWILSIDADEALTPELKDQINQVKLNPTFQAYKLRRLTNYCGKWIKHCGWYPDRKTRLYNRTAGSWQGEQIHEHWEAKDAHLHIEELKGDMLHYSYYTISDHLRQIERFTEISAKVAAGKGKDCSLFKIWLVPKWVFFSMYILRAGFLDGYYGYLVCKYSAYAALIKYTKIRQYRGLMN